MPEVQCQRDSLATASRRSFLKSAAALAVAGPGLVRGGDTSTKRIMQVYVGTYSSRQDAEGRESHGQGIYLFEMDPASGALVEKQAFPNDSNPAWIAFNPSRTHLYSAKEVGKFHGARFGLVSAYAVEPLSGRLALLNTVSSEGAGPAHLSIHPSSRFVLVASYRGGTVAVLPVRPNGELGRPTSNRRKALQAQRMRQTHPWAALPSAATTRPTPT